MQPFLFAKWSLCRFFVTCRAATNTKESIRN
jgi:hypothetical protein